MKTEVNYEEIREQKQADLEKFLEAYESHHSPSTTGNFCTHSDGSLDEDLIKTPRITKVE